MKIIVKTAIINVLFLVVAILVFAVSDSVKNYKLIDVLEVVLNSWLISMIFFYILAYGEVIDYNENIWTQSS